MVKRLLIVDDDRALSPLVQEYLIAKGFETLLSHNAVEGLNVFIENQIDLCILDVKMPMKDGFILAKEMQNYKTETPFLFLTSVSQKENRIKGLKMGASDYILKPFSMEELYLRIKNILKLNENLDNNHQKNKCYEIGLFTFNSHTRELIYDSETTILSTTENNLLKVFCDSKDNYISRERVLKNIWEDEYMLKSRSLNVYVSKLRKLLIRDPSISFQNVHGIGYRMLIN